MKRKSIILVLLAVLTLFIAQTALTADSTKAAPAEPATGEEINWQVISSGGTSGSSASYDLEGTVGQVVVGEGSSASYGLSHGFWQEFGGGGTCCNGDGMRGDVDGDASINVADVVWLVDYVFFGGAPPVCEDDPGVFPEADADGDGSVTVGDVVLLVDYVFFGGPPPAPCP